MTSTRTCPFGPYRPLEALPPRGEDGLRFGEEFSDERPECLSEPGEGNAALKLVELAGDEKSAPLHHGTFEVVDQR